LCTNVDKTTNPLLEILHMSYILVTNDDGVYAPGIL